MISKNYFYWVGGSQFYAFMVITVLTLSLVQVPTSYSLPTNVNKTDQRTQHIRTAYLFNLLRFLSWHKDSPYSTSDYINLCTSASDSEYKTLKKLESQKVNGKDIKITQLFAKVKAVSKNKKDPCHLVYLVPIKGKYKAAADRKMIKRITQYHTQKAVTVGNGEEFIKNGGIVAIVLNNNRMRLNINYKKAKSIGVHMSANLLEAAHIVH